jgi:hypothetical protein
MYLYIVIGATGSGKSEWVKETVRDKRAFVFDVQNEYGSRTKYRGQKPLNFSDNLNAMQSRYVPKSPRLKDDAMKFMEMCRTKRNTIIVFEESTIFFEGRTDDLTRTLIVNKIHTGNVYVFIFHSIAAVPPRIMQMCNFVVLHKTLDEDTTVARKYNRLYMPYLDLQPQPMGSRVIIKLMD